MIHGKVNAYQEATIPLQLRGKNRQTEDVEAVIDTGFSGFLTLSPALVVGLQLLPWGTSEFTLGDGSEAIFDVYIVTLLWDGQERDIFVLAAEGGPLVGMSLLEGFRLAVDVIENGAVTIEAL